MANDYPNDDPTGEQVSRERAVQAFEALSAAFWTPGALDRLLNGRQLLLHPGNGAALLRSMGLLDGRARLPDDKVHKLRQINHMIQFLEPALEDLGEGPLVLLDAGCGRSALGFLVAWWMAQRNRNVQLIGIDRNERVIEGCRRRAEVAGLHNLRFEVLELGALAAIRELCGARLDGLFALHACDTATDDALMLAVALEARMFAVAPCCQAELARRWVALPGPLSGLRNNPHLRRTLGALTTDAMRAELMREAGYQVRLVEFVEAHHTPKNTLVYGHFTGERGNRDAYDDLVEQTGGVGIALEGRLRQGG